MGELPVSSRGYVQSSRRGVVHTRSFVSVECSGTLTVLAVFASASTVSIPSCAILSLRKPFGGAGTAVGTRQIDRSAMAAEFRALPVLDIADFDDVLPLGPADLRYGTLDNGLKYVGTGSPHVNACD